jgi:hypothetical protein
MSPIPAGNVVISELTARTQSSGALGVVGVLGCCFCCTESDLGLLGSASGGRCDFICALRLLILPKTLEKKHCVRYGRIARPLND